MKEFIVTEETRYGPKLSLVERESVDNGSEAAWLTLEQRRQLRALLLVLGISVTAMKKLDWVEEPVVADLPKYTEMQPEPLMSEGVEDIYVVPDPEEVEGDFGLEVADLAESIPEYDLEKTLSYAEKPVRGAEHMSREEYVRHAIEFSKWNEETSVGVPPTVEAELRKILPGLCAQESRFDASRVSGDGAKGILQFIPKTWKYYGGKPGEEVSLKRQVEIAGRFLSDLYRQLNSHLGTDTLNLLQEKFVSVEDMQRDLLVPLVINSYNVGAKRMSDAVEQYVNSVAVSSMPTGKDLYLAIADYAKEATDGSLGRYNDHSRLYTSKVYAFANRIDDPDRG